MAAISGDDPRVRARATLELALGFLAPAAIVLQDGSVRLRDAEDRLDRKVVRRLDRRLKARARAGVTDDRLAVEAIAYFGAEIERARGGRRADGATTALDRLLDRRDLSAAQRAESQALLREVLTGNTLTSWPELKQFMDAQAAPPSTERRSLAADILTAARSLSHDTETYVRSLATPEAPSTGTGIEAQYDEFRRLAREWHEQGEDRGSRQLLTIQHELEDLVMSIQRAGHPAPVLPWAGPTVVADQESPSDPAERLREQVRRQITKLESAASDHLKRAATRAESSGEARGQAATLFATADEQASLHDTAAAERARRFRVRAVARVRVAERHTRIAESCVAAADQAGAAAGVYRTLLRAADAGAGPEQLADLARDATQQVRAYEWATAATLPSPDVLQNGLPSGRLPHLTALSYELNQALRKRKNSFRFTPDLLHRTLRGESRRILSPDGIVLTIGNDPRADVSELVQLELKLDPGELHEVLNSPVGFDEAQVGQVVQGGFNVATSATDRLGTTGAAGLRSVTDGLPDSSKLKALAELASPGAEVADDLGVTVTGGATEFAQSGAVEALRGEFLRYRSPRPRWIWRIRDSALADWSAAQVVHSGGEPDAGAFDLGYSHTYTVGPPGNQTSLADVGLPEERGATLPEHFVSRADGLNELSDRAVAELRVRLGSLDRVGHDRLRGLLTDDAMIRLDETTRPGGVWRLITNGGRPVAWAQLESVADLDTAELLSDSSPDHKLELWRVGNSGASGGQTFASSRTVSGTAATALADIGSTSTDLTPGARAGRSKGEEEASTTSDVGSRWSTQRIAPTVGVKLGVRHKLTVHRLDRAESFTVDGSGDVCLRMAERDAFRYGLPVPDDALSRDADGDLRRGVDGRVLLRGDPHPAEAPPQLPVWLGTGPRQLRGAGPAMIRELSGADDALRDLLPRLSKQSLIPPLDDSGRPLPAKFAGQDPAVLLSQAENWERTLQQLAKHRLETGYDQACQEGLVFQLTEHRTGQPPRIRSYRIAVQQHFDRAKPIGVADSDMVVNVDIGVSASGRSGSRSRSFPWSLKFGLGNKPGPGNSGRTPSAGLSIGRTTLGRMLAWATGNAAYRMTVTESSSPVAVFDVPHTVTVTEVTADGDSAPIAQSEGSARVCLDSEFCAAPEPPVLALAGRVDPNLLQTATIQHVDVRDPVRRLTEAVPELRRGDSSALHHISAFLATRNLVTRPELLTTEYRTGLAVSAAPSDPLQAVAQRSLAPRRTSLGITTRVENLAYVGSASPIVADLNVTFASASSTSGASSGASAGASAGTGSVTTDGEAQGASLGVTRSTTKSASTTEAATSAVERSLMRDGQHYQFWGDLVLEAELRAGGAEPRRVELETGAVFLTLPERDALRSYGRGKLDLPLHKVSDAVERLLNGNLDLPRRTTAALVRRYRAEKGQTDTGLAAEHTDERLADLLRRVTGGTVQPDERLDRVLDEVDELTRQRVEVPLPRHYQQLMGAGQVDRSSLQDEAGNDTDLLREVYAAVEQHSPQALDDPVLAASLRGELSGPRWRHQLDNMLDPRGFVREYPIDDAGRPRNIRVRVRVQFTGPVTSEAGGTAGQSGNGFGLVQLWDLRERNRSVSAGTAYDGRIDLSGTSDASGTAGIGTGLGTSTTATSSELTTRISTGLAVETARVERDYRVMVEVDDNSTGAPPTRREAGGRLSLSVPASVIDSAPPPYSPGLSDHRSADLPANYLVEGSQPYLTGAEPTNTLLDAASRRLARTDLLGPAGVQLHGTTLESLLGASNRAVTFQEMARPTGHQLIPLAVPGQVTRVVAVRVRAEVSGVELVSEPDAEATTQLGENTRQLRTAQLTAKSNRLLPTTKSVSATSPGGEVTVGASVGDQVTEKDTGTVGARHETGVYESGQVVTVKLTVDYHLDFERRRLDRHNKPKVERSASLHRAAQGETYVTMFRRDYDAMRAQMEAGRTRPAKSVRTRTVRVEALADAQHPYSPLVDALDQARTHGVRIRLTVRGTDGTRQRYLAKPDGTLSSGRDRKFAAAFATLHPRLPLLAEGRVDLRELFAAGGRPQRFTPVVVDALQQKGVPASVLAETDSRMHRSRLFEEPDNLPPRRAAGPASGMSIG
ncbi:hypothetical protein FB561_5574 [Kribbella amoyensis]|uniref:Uncharacterized protein n=1 Tax=Kribbella amoyensis TaxID=996641 RepID=A0A561C015_9ACTN|nr:hypothetical protein [Kribbella amoyensis]TWD84387.1 hypothetical protein FB561_5574 [Kribbella amoyensis]